MDSPPEPSDPLDSWLNRWSETPEPSANLTREIWRRIALREAKAQPRSWGLLEQFSRPFFAAVFVFGCVVTGLFLAEVRVARQQTEVSAQLAKSYLQLIDPLLRDSSPEARK
jgi:hypothetical protein